MKKALVVFYSRTGKVRQIASKAAEFLEADLEELVDHSKWTGPDGFFRSVKAARAKGGTTLSAPRFDPKDYEKVFVFSPVWVETIAPAIRTYLRQHKDSLSELNLIVIGKFSNTSGSVKEVTEDMGFKLKRALGLLDKGWKHLDENIPRLKELTERQ